MPRRELMRFSASNRQEYTETLGLLEKSGARIISTDETDGALLIFYRMGACSQGSGGYAKVVEKSFSCAPTPPKIPAGSANY